MNGKSNSTKLVMKHEVNPSNLIRPTVEDRNEEDVKNNEIKKLLSIIIAQEEQLERHDKLLNALLRTEQTRKTRNRVYRRRILLLLSLLLLFVVIYMGYISSTYLHKDTVLFLNVKATPTKAPFITAGVKVRFTMGDLVSCIKGAFSGDTIDLSLS